MSWGWRGLKKNVAHPPLRIISGTALIIVVISSSNSSSSSIRSRNEIKSSLLKIWLKVTSAYNSKNAFRKRNVFSLPLKSSKMVKILERGNYFMTLDPPF